MFNSGILDVAIGLIFVYLLLSLVCTAVNEIIEARLKKRAVDLQHGIWELLQGDEQLVQKLYNHPLVFSLFAGSYVSKADAYAKKKWFVTGENLPSYIPSRNFALALMDILLPPESTTRGMSGTAGTTVSRPVALALTGTGDAVASPAPPAGPGPLQPLRDAVSSLKNEAVRGALLPLIDAAGDDASKARENIEGWFDSTMDRVSGWYKRRVHKFILLIGLAVAVLTNADTITIGSSLSRDVALRNALVAAAGEYAKAPRSPASSLPAPAPFDKAKDPVCKDDGESPDCLACEKDLNSPECRAARNLAQLGQLGLPIGWDSSDPRTVPRDGGGWLTKLLGLLITAAAISLGAPFWFDMLNKVMVIRSTVKPREKSPDEPAVDRK